MRLGISTLVVALLVFGGTIAHADDHARARAAFKRRQPALQPRRVSARRSTSFARRIGTTRIPSFLFNIAQCERQLGHKREAVREYHAYLNNAPEEAANRDAIKQIIAQLEKEITDEQNTTRMPPTSVTPPTTPLMTAPAPTPAAPSSIPAGAALTASAPPHAERTPAYKKWWVWTIVGGVVVAGAAAGLAVALTQKGAPTATTSLGTRSPF